MNATPREPFDAEEVRIARVYGALPQGEPSPALDARILAQARTAVAKAPARRRPWILGAGLGTAAAAVFAAGIAWQLGAFKPDRGLSSIPEQQPAAEEEVERIDIEFLKDERQREQAPPPAPAAPKPQSVGETRGGVAGKERDAQPFPAEAPAAPVVLDEPVPMAVEAPLPPPAAAPMPGTATDSAASAEVMNDAAPSADVDLRAQEVMATPPATTAEVLMESPADTAAPMQSSAASAEAPQYREDLRETKDDAGPAGADAEGRLARRRASELGATAGTRPEPAGAASGVAAPQRAASDSAASRDELATRSAQLAKLAGLPPWTEDAVLAPEPWLERVRDRVQAGDRQGAEHSLRRFVLAHPDRPVPRDLQRLLVE